MTYINKQIKGIDLKFKTSSNLFSPNNIDKGTLAMLSVIDLNNDDKILDLGCGYGVVGILYAKLIGSNNVVMIDNDIEAVNIAILNAKLNSVSDVKIYQSDGLNQVSENDFTLILSNPPYHADFSIPKSFIERGFNRLKIGGKMFMVTKRKEWYKNKLISIFGGVKIFEINDYYVFMAEKRSFNYNKAKNKNKFSKKYNKNKQKS